MTGPALATSPPCTRSLSPRRPASLESIVRDPELPGHILVPCLRRNGHGRRDTLGPQRHPKRQPFVGRHPRQRAPCLIGAPPFVGVSWENHHATVLRPPGLGQRSQWRLRVYRTELDCAISCGFGVTATAPTTFQHGPVLHVKLKAG
jgi:hypothetical protein